MLQDLITKEEILQSLTNTLNDIRRKREAKLQLKGAGEANIAELQDRVLRLNFEFSDRQK